MNDTIKEENFEMYLKEISSCLEKLEDENLSLHQSMGYYKEGMEKLKKAQKMLEDAKIQCLEIKRELIQKD